MLAIWFRVFGTGGWNYDELCSHGAHHCGARIILAASYAFDVVVFGQSWAILEIVHLFETN
jgi:hypothetical protein